MDKQFYDFDHRLSDDKNGENCSAMRGEIIAGVFSFLSIFILVIMFALVFILAPTEKRYNYAYATNDDPTPTPRPWFVTNAYNTTTDDKQEFWSDRLEDVNEILDNNGAHIHITMPAGVEITDASSYPDIVYREGDDENRLQFASLAEPQGSGDPVSLVSGVRVWSVTAGAYEVWYGYSVSYSNGRLIFIPSNAHAVTVLHEMIHLAMGNSYHNPSDGYVMYEYAEADDVLLLPSEIDALQAYLDSLEG